MPSAAGLEEGEAWCQDRLAGHDPAHMAGTWAALDYHNEGVVHCCLCSMGMCKLH